MTGPERDEFDRMIEQDIAGTVPAQSVVDEVNPWHEPIDRIAWGLTLTGFTLNFLYLQYLLPAVGVVLQYLGFRALRRNGAAFRAAWAISMVRLIWFAAFLVLEATPGLPVVGIDLATGLTSLVVQVVQLLLLRAGLRQVYQKVGITPERDPLRSAVCWQIVCAVLAFSPLAHSWLVGIPVIIAFVCIVRALFRLGGELSQAGYCFVAAPVRLSAGWVKLGYLGGCLLLVLAACVLVSHPPLDETPMEEHGETEIRQQLADLGVPDEVLADLADEDVRALDGAFYIERYEEMQTFHTGKGHEDNMVLPEAEAELPHASPRAEQRDKARAAADRCPVLRVHTVYLELPEDRMAVLNWFRWERGSAYWGDAFKTVSYNDLGAEVVGARMVYDRKGTAYTAPVPDLADGMVTANGYFGMGDSRQISGTVSYPFGAENPRGYVLYVMYLDENSLYGGTNFVYYHAAHPFRLPYLTPLERASRTFDDAVWNHYSNYSAQRLYEQTAAQTDDEL